MPSNKADQSAVLTAIERTQPDRQLSSDWNQQLDDALCKLDVLRSELRAGNLRDDTAAWVQLETALLNHKAKLPELVVSVSSGIGEFAAEFLRHYSPQEIDKAARMEKRTWEPMNRARWRKFVDLTGNWTKLSLQRRIEHHVYSAASSRLRASPDVKLH